MTIKNYISKTIIRNTYTEWSRDRTMRLGAGLAYYGVFAILPALTLMVGVAGTFFSRQDISNLIENNLKELFGGQLSLDVLSIQSEIENSLNSISFSSIGLVGMAALIISVSFIFVAFQDALDTIWHSPKLGGIQNYVKRYILAYGAVLISSTLVFVGLIIYSVSSLARYLIPGSIEQLEYVADLVVSAAAIAAGCLLLATIYKLLLRVNISWRTILAGSFVTIVMMILGTIALSYYLSTIASQSFNGALGGAVLVLVWIYYESQIFLIGAQYMKVVAMHKDELTLPKSA